MFNGAFKVVNAFFNGLSNCRFIYRMDSCLPFRLNCKEYIHLYLDLQWYTSVDNLLPQSLWPLCLASILVSKTCIVQHHLWWWVVLSIQGKWREKLSLVEIDFFFIARFLYNYYIYIINHILFLHFVDYYNCVYASMYGMLCCTTEDQRSLGVSSLNFVLYCSVYFRISCLQASKWYWLHLLFQHWSSGIAGVDYCTEHLVDTNDHVTCHAFCHKCFPWCDISIAQIKLVF